MVLYYVLTDCCLFQFILQHLDGINKVFILDLGAHQVRVYTYGHVGFVHYNEYCSFYMSYSYSYYVFP